MTQTGEARGFKPLNTGGFMGEIGPLLSRRDGEGGFVYALETDARHVNGIGLIHGGVTGALLDQAIAMLAWEASERAPTVTVQMDTRFLEAARPGDFLEARARLAHRAGSMLFLDGELRAGGRPVAMATAVMKILRKGA